MPIANCIVSPDCPTGSGNLIELWAAESRQSADHMTINLIDSKQQFGQKYLVMATLTLPTIWSDTAMSCLQLGLAKALEIYFGVNAKDIHIVTNVVESGRVVENGLEQTW